MSLCAVTSACARAAGNGCAPISRPSGCCGVTRPFRLREDPPASKGQTINDIAHTWTTQHLSWNSGEMDAFVTARTSGEADQ